jgi:hypothetical protein
MTLPDVINQFLIVPQPAGKLVPVYSDCVGMVGIAVFELQHPMGSCDFSGQRTCLLIHVRARHLYSVRQNISEPMGNGPVIAKRVCPDDDAAHPMHPVGQLPYGFGGQPLAGDPVGKKNEKMALGAGELAPMENDEIRKLISQSLNFRAGPPPVMLRQGDPCEPRISRRKLDFYNSLLDFAYSTMLFTRLNVLLRSRGLNPYLGFLHSHKDYYESLVTDLQEPFRARMDRLVVKLINLKVIKRTDFVVDDKTGGYRLNSDDAVPRFLEAFERECAVRMRGDGGTLKQLMVAQVQVLLSWVEEKGELFFYQTHRHKKL